MYDTNTMPGNVPYREEYRVHNERKRRDLEEANNVVNLMLTPYYYDG